MTSLHTRRGKSIVRCSTRAYIIAANAAMAVLGANLRYEARLR